MSDKSILVEMLLIVKGLDGMFYLKDSKGFVIGSFETVDDAIKWCNENHYRVRMA